MIYYKVGGLLRDRLKKRLVSREKRHLDFLSLYFLAHFPAGAGHHTSCDLRCLVSGPDVGPGISSDNLDYLIWLNSNHGYCTDLHVQNR